MSIRSLRMVSLIAIVPDSECRIPTLMVSSAAACCDVAPMRRSGAASIASQGRRVVFMGHPLHCGRGTDFFDRPRRPQACPAIPREPRAAARKVRGARTRAKVDGFGHTGRDHCLEDEPLPRRLSRPCTLCEQPPHGREGRWVQLLPFCRCQLSVQPRNQLPHQGKIPAKTRSGSARGNVSPMPSRWAARSLLHSGKRPPRAAPGGSRTTNMQMPLVLDPTAGQSLTSQLVGQLRDAIRRGRIARGTKLPSSRRLSEQLGVSSNTVVRAYEELSSEGYVEARPASCVAVAADLPDSHSLPPDAAPGLQRDDPTDRPPMPMPALALRAPDLGHRNRGRLSFDFFPGRPDAGLFPIKTWRRLVQNFLSHGGAVGLSQYGDPAGA